MEQDRKKEVIENCLNLFITKGLSETSTRDLSASLKLQNAGLYYYFSSRSEAVISCVEAAVLRMENIYVDVPQFQEIEEGLTEVFIERGIKYVAITANWKAEASSLEDAHEKCFEKFADNMANYQGGINSISITNSQKKTINGVEMIRFEGKINYGTDTKMDGYAVGYTFIMDNIPCEIIGSVIENDQSSAAINEITSIVDAMSLTVRNAE